MPSKIQIAVDNSYARIKTDNRAALRELKESLTYYSQGHQFQYSYKLWKKTSGRIGWDGRTCLLHDNEDGTHRFAAGYLDRAVTLLREFADVNVRDLRIEPEPHPSLVGGFITEKFRDWQLDAMEAIRQNHHGVIQAATGAGKTTLMAATIAERAQTTLVLVNRSTLMKQAYERFQKIIKFPNAYDPFGMAGGNIWSPGLITIGMYKTIDSMMSSDREATIQWLQNFKQVLFDEAHHVPARTFFNVANGCREAFFRNGFSATPWKSKDKETELKLVGACGESIYTYSISEAIDDKILVPPRLYMVDANFEEIEGHDEVTGKYVHPFHKEYRDGLVEFAPRNELIAWIAEQCAAAGLPTLILTQQAKHGRILNDLIKTKHKYLDGSSSLAEREVSKEQLANGKLPIIIATTIFDEGEDVPAIGALILAGGYKAGHLAIQRIGRGLRIAPGKLFVLVFDFLDRQAEHLQRHSKSRRKAWKDENLDPQTISRTRLKEMIAKGELFR